MVYFLIDARRVLVDYKVIEVTILLNFIKANFANLYAPNGLSPNLTSHTRTKFAVLFNFSKLKFSAFFLNEQNT